MKKFILLIVTLTFLCACAGTVARPILSGQVEISKTPPAWVLEMYSGSDKGIQVRGVQGVRNSETGKIWVADSKFIPHEAGHELWDTLTEADKRQWREWFAKGLFVSPYSENEKEFFPEHYYHYCNGKAFVQARPGWPRYGSIATYARVFPDQAQWFQNLQVPAPVSVQLSARKE